MRMKIPTHRFGDLSLAAPSLAHTVGNVTQKFTKKLREIFGKGYFKTVHIDSRIAYVEHGYNSKKEHFHKNNPTLAIRPSIDLTNDDIFLHHCLLTTNKYGQNFGVGGQNMLPFFYDPEIGCSIFYLLDRVRVIFGVYMEFDTVIEQINAHATFNAFYTPDTIMYERTAIEIHIPHQFMQMVSIDSGIPIYDENGSVERFLKYVNSHCCKPVTFQMKTSTANEEFFMYYPLNIEWIITDVDRSELDKKGFASEKAYMTFTLSTEFNTCQLFAYRAPEDSDSIKHEFTNVEIRVPDFKGQPLIVPIITYENMFDPEDEHGWKYFTSRMYKVDSNEGDDVLDLSKIFEGTNLKDIIQYHNLHGIDNHLLMDVHVDMAGVKLVEGRDYVFDYNTLQLITKKVNTIVTYRFYIYVNNEYVNDLLLRVNEDQLTFTKKE